MATPEDGILSVEEILSRLNETNINSRSVWLQNISLVKEDVRASYVVGIYPIQWAYMVGEEKLIENVKKLGADINLLSYWRVNAKKVFGLRYDLQEILMKEMKNRVNHENVNTNCITVSQEYLELVRMGEKKTPSLDVLPISWALMHNSMVMLEYLKKMNVNVNQYDCGLEMYPLFTSMAGRTVNPKCINWLIQEHANVNQEGKYGLIPLEYALTSSSNVVRSARVINILCNAGSYLSGESFATLLTDFPYLPYENNLTFYIQSNEDRVYNPAQSYFVCSFAPFICREGFTFDELTVLTKIGKLNNSKVVKHPLVSIFILSKWACLKTYHYFMLISAILFSILMTHQILAQNPEVISSEVTDFSSNETKQSINYILITLTIFNSFTLVNSIIHRKTASLIQPYIYFKLIINIMSFIMLCDYIKGNRSNLISHLEAIMILIIWVKPTVVLAQTPGFGSYVAIFTKVVLDILKLLVVYSIVIMAFALSFRLVFRDQPAFQDWRLIFIKCVTMMMGEYDFDNMFIDHQPTLFGTGHIIFLIFVFLLGIVLVNLLIGLSVSDIQSIKEGAEATSLRLQINAITQVTEFFDFFLIRILAPRLSEQLKSHLNLSNYLLFSNVLYHDRVHDYKLVLLKKKSPERPLHASVFNFCKKIFSGIAPIQLTDIASSIPTKIIDAAIWTRMKLDHRNPEKEGDDSAIALLSNQISTLTQDIHLIMSRLDRGSQ